MHDLMIAYAISNMSSSAIYVTVKALNTRAFYLYCARYGVLPVFIERDSAALRTPQLIYRLPKRIPPKPYLFRVVQSSRTRVKYY